MSATAPQFTDLTLGKRLWWIFLQVPGILIVGISLFWGADIWIRFKNEAMVVWLVVVSPVWAYAATVLCVPVLIAVQFICARARIKAGGSIAAQAVALFFVGALIGANVQMISGAAAAACGAFVGALSAWLPVPSPTERIERAS